MGNEICCQQPVSEFNKQKIYQLSSKNDNGDFEQSQKKSISKFEDSTSKIPLPILSQQIQNALYLHKPFEQQFSNQANVKTVRFGNDVYVGPLNEDQRPTSLGKMYKQNGAFFIGNFIDGKAVGPCFYVLKDGSYFKGQMKNNKAECQKGTYVSKNLQYTGGFKNNEFHGKGSQRTLNQLYLFQGIYEHGKKKQGVMKWGSKIYDYIYEGKFNQNGQFTGKSILTDPQGVYEGQFVNGQKHGFGTYFYNSKLRYEGKYQHNKKQGQGKIVNCDGSIAYKGVFRNGLPNGKGVAISKNGLQFEADWVDGIDARLL